MSWKVSCVSGAIACVTFTPAFPLSRAFITTSSRRNHARLRILLSGIARNGDLTNDRAKARFKAAGITYESEPDWIKGGRKADFHCSGAADFWCEVKTLEPLEDARQLGKALAKLRQRTGNISLTGQGAAYVKGNLSDRDAKTVVALLKRGLRRFADSDAPERIVAQIPDEPDYGSSFDSHFRPVNTSRWSFIVASL